jgi:rhodanese-related sulfurtransferase
MRRKSRNMLFQQDRSGRISPSEAHQRVQAGEAVLVDVREQPEWSTCHAPCAVHLPLSGLPAQTRIPTSVKGRPVVAVCRSGNRSQRAAQLLAARGVDVVDVEGGMIAWERAGLPVSSPRGC